MADCELLKTCIFFNDQMANMPAVADLMKKRYCRDNFKECARMQVVDSVGRGKVPADMFPNQNDYAHKVIGGK